MIQMSHKEIASDLGTSREVVSRITKKLQAENILIQQPTPKHRKFAMFWCWFFFLFK